MRSIMVYIIKHTGRFVRSSEGDEMIIQGRIYYVCTSDTEDTDRQEVSENMPYILKIDIIETAVR